MYWSCNDPWMIGKHYWFEVQASTRWQHDRLNCCFRVKIQINIIKCVLTDTTHYYYVCLYLFLCVTVNQITSSSWISQVSIPHLHWTSWAVSASFFLTFWPRIYFTLLLRKNMFPASAAGSCNERKKETPDTVSDWMVNTAQCLPAEKQDISLRSRQGTKTQPKRLNIGKSACHLQR